jgi:hypothetical protein
MVLTSGYEINVQEFKEYCLSAAKYYNNLYPWYYMPPTKNKILVHEADVIKHALLPIDNFSKYLYFIRRNIIF